MTRLQLRRDVEAAMKDKPPGPVLCLHCGNDKAERLPSPGDYSDYRCPTCGEYRVAGAQERCFDAGTADPRKAQIIVDANGQRWLE